LLHQIGPNPWCKGIQTDFSPFFLVFFPIISEDFGFQLFFVVFFSIISEDFGFQTFFLVFFSIISEDFGFLTPQIGLDLRCKADISQASGRAHGKAWQVESSFNLRHLHGHLPHHHVSFFSLQNSRLQGPSAKFLSKLISRTILFA